VRPVRLAAGRAPHLVVVLPHQLVHAAFAATGTGVGLGHLVVELGVQGVADVVHVNQLGVVDAGGHVLDDAFEAVEIAAEDPLHLAALRPDLVQGGNGGPHGRQQLLGLLRSDHGFLLRGSCSPSH
jgi:hypothetical protein